MDKLEETESLPAAQSHPSGVKELIHQASKSTSVEMVVDKFKEATAQFAAYKRLIPCRSRSAPQIMGDPGPSGSADHRQAQRQSVATRAHPPMRSRTQKRQDLNKAKKDLREVIEAKSAGNKNPPCAKGK